MKTFLSVVILFFVTIGTKTSQAVHLSQDGTGQVLLFPFYAVDEGFQNLLTIVNTTDEVKAVSVRFREGSNHRSVASFHLYLGAFDSWAGALFSFNGSDAAKLITLDNSCTVPDIIGQTTLAPDLPMNSGIRYLEFSNELYTGFGDDEGPDDVSRTRNGMIEVIEMAVLTDESEMSATAASLVNGEVNDCAQINRAWATDQGMAATGAYWVTTPTTDTQPPTGGLSGTLSMIDVIEAVQMTYRAEAIGGFTTSSLHTSPGDSFPSLGAADFDVDADLFVDSYIQNPMTGEVIKSSWARGIDAVSALFMSDQISDNLARDLAINATTEWLVGFPTKRFYTDGPLVGPQAIPPFLDLYLVADPNQDGACEDIRSQSYTRDAEPGEAAPGATLTLCHGNNIVRFPGLSNGSIFNSGLLAVDEPMTQIEKGWVKFDLGTNPVSMMDRQLVDEEGRVYHGLPVIGYSVQTIRNNISFGPDVVGNYGSITKHRTKQRIDPVPAGSQ